MTKIFNKAQRHCAKVSLKAKAPMLENILEHAVAGPTESGLLSRPKFCDYGRDGLVRKAGRTACSVFSTSRPPVLLENGACGFKSQHGATMHHTPTGTTTPTTTSYGHSTDEAARHLIAHNALATASWHLARGDVDKALGRILRTAAHLKSTRGAATTNERASA